MARLFFPISQATARLCLTHLLVCLCLCMDRVTDLLLLLDNVTRKPSAESYIPTGDVQTHLFTYCSWNLCCLPHLFLFFRLPGLAKAKTGRTRAKTKREPTITVDPTNQEEFVSALEAMTDLIPDKKEERDDVLHACRALQVRICLFPLRTLCV